MQPTRFYAASKRGFTLTEAAIVLGIVGLILGAIWVAAAAVYNNLRVSRTSQELLQMAQAIRAMHATSNTMDTGATAILTWINAGIVPTDMVSGTGASATAQDIWGGAVTVTPATSAVTGDAFAISFANVPQGACTNLLVRNSGAGRDTGLIGATAGSAVNATNATTFPLTVTSATNACTSTSNTVTFTFKLKG